MTYTDHTNCIHCLQRTKPQQEDSHLVKDVLDGVVMMDPRGGRYVGLRARELRAQPDGGSSGRFAMERFKKMGTLKGHTGCVNTYDNLTQTELTKGDMQPAHRQQQGRRAVRILQLVYGLMEGPAQE